MLVIKRPSDGNWLVLSQAQTITPTLDGNGLLAYMGAGVTMVIPNLTLEQLEGIEIVSNITPPIVMLEREWCPFDSYLAPTEPSGEIEVRDEREHELF